MTARVLITAGASGIGLAMAKAFQGTGARVRVSDVDDAALAALPDGIEGRHADATDEPSVADIANDIKQDWGGLDVLCANAGIAGPTAPVDQIDLEDWRKCVSVTLEGAFLAAKHAVPMMRAAGSGSIILTASTAGLYGYPGRAPYAAAKWAIIGLMKTLAMELGPHGIRANAIAPGAVEGERMEAVLAAEATAKGVTRDQVYAGYAGGTSMKRFVTADDIANMAVFLASDAARLVSGQVIAVDGHTVNAAPGL